MSLGLFRVFVRLFLCVFFCGASCPKSDFCEFSTICAICAISAICASWSIATDVNVCEMDMASFCLSFSLSGSSVVVLLLFLVLFSYTAIGQLVVFCSFLQIAYNCRSVCLLSLRFVFPSLFACLLFCLFSFCPSLLFFFVWHGQLVIEVQFLRSSN